jgi:hypothetical protein
MNDKLRVRFWVETSLALISGFLFLLTIIWKDWIEKVFGIDPDAHSGTAEWSIVLVCMVVTATSVALARYEWRRALASTI